MASELTDVKEELSSELKGTYRKLYETSQTAHPVKGKEPLYVEGGIEVLKNHQSNHERWKTLKTYRDMFLDPEIKSNRVIVQARPVCGKSFLTLKLAHDWSSHDSYLKDVALLILLKYEQLASVGSIYECIKQHLLPDSSKLTVDTIERILLNASPVLLVLDGVDEHTGELSKINEDVLAIMGMKRFPHFDVILTTRSLRIPEKVFIESKLLRITGFNTLSQDACIREIITNDVDYDNTGCKIKESLHADKILEDLCRVPSFLVLYINLSLENELIGRYTTITSYFQHVISFLYDHLKRKFEESNPREVMDYKSHNRKLNKVAYDSVTLDYGKSWTKGHLTNALGGKSYYHYLRLGIFFEEFITSFDPEDGTRPVRFNQELFCQWYAANYVVDAISSESSELEAENVEYLFDLLEDLCPSDQLNVYRFVCGIYPGIAKHIIHYISGMEGCEEFKILCILEQSGEEELVLKSVREHCSKSLHLANVDSNLLHRSTLQILAMASRFKVTVQSLMLHEAFQSVDVSKSEIILTSGHHLPTQNTLERLWIEMTGYEWSEDELKKLFMYAVNCENLNSISFSLSVLPRQFVDAAILSRLSDSCIEVLWYPALLHFRLNLKSGYWEHTSQKTVITNAEYEREVYMCRDAKR